MEKEFAIALLQDCAEASRYLIPPRRKSKRFSEHKVAREFMIGENLYAIPLSCRIEERPMVKKLLITLKPLKVANKVVFEREATLTNVIKDANARTKVLKLILNKTNNLTKKLSSRVEINKKIWIKN